MALVKYKFRPGINKELTSYANEGGWLDSDKIRFRFGNPEKIGGWSKNSPTSFLGTCREIHTFKTSELTHFNSLGTHLKWYIQEGNNFYDITPIDNTTAAGDVTFTATEGSSTLTVNDTSHNRNPGDFVTFSGATTMGGNVTAAVLNQEYEIVSTTTNTYTITMSVSATATDASNSPGGGSSAVAAYQYGVGLDVFVAGTGWGAGFWGESTWGSTSPVAVFSQLRLWSIDNFGQDLVAVPRGGPLFIWQKANGLSTRAVLGSSLAGASNCPISALQIMTSDVDRHLIALGCNPIGSSVVDPLFVRWSDSENMIDWTPSATNSAGGVKLSSGSQIIGAVQTRQETLIFTDSSIFSMRFVGSPFYFSFNEIARGIGMIAPKAGAAIGGSVYFMDDGAFYRATGSIEQIPCTVLDHVFSDMNKSQRFKIFAANNSEHNEVIWFYPSANSTEIDRYVTYNYLEKVWTVGTTSDGYTRTAWNLAPTLDYPLATGKLDDTQNNYLYNHEFGNTADGNNFSAYIESADIDLDPAGEQFMFVSKVIPDIQFINSTSNSDTVNLIIKGRKYPAETQSVLSTLALTPITTFKNTRGRTRQIAVRLETNSGDFSWRLGDTRIDVRTDGRK